MPNETVLTMRGICKQFPGVRALNKVDFTLRKGEIHALMGENGAGKSTLIKVLTGVYEKDAGSIRLEGVDGEANIHSPQDAQNIGIATVYQEITLCPNLTVAENMYIGRGKEKLVRKRNTRKRRAGFWKTWAFRPDPDSSWPAVPWRCSRWSPSPGRWICSARC